MLNEHRLTIDGADERRRLVAVLEIGTVLARQLLHHAGAIDGLGVDSHEIGHAVAPVDVQHLAVGTDAVGGVDVAAMLGIIVQSPVLPVGRPEVVEVVQIGALHMEHLAEESLLSHV